MVTTSSKTSRLRVRGTPLLSPRSLAWKRVRQNKVLLFAGVLACVWILQTALPAMGADTPQATGLDYLQRITDNITQTAGWWDQLWDDTFDPEQTVNSINNRVIMGVVQYVLLAGFMAWSWRIGRKIFDRGSDISDWVKFIIPVVLVTFFLSNSGQAIYQTAHGLRKIVNAAPAEVAKIQVAGFNVRLAINDALFTQTTKTVISQEAQKCAQLQPPGVNLTQKEKDTAVLSRRLREAKFRNQKGAPLSEEERLSIYKAAAIDQIQCLESLDKFIGEQREILKKGCPECKTAQEFVDRTQESVKEILLRNASEMASKGFDAAIAAGKTTALFAINPGFALAEMILPDWQTILTEVAMIMAWAFVAGQELSLLLAALMGPIAFALGTIPHGQNAIIEWLLFFARVLLVRLAYVILIGFVALMLAGVTAAPLVFPLFFGIFAPYVAYKAVNDGVGAAADSFRSNVTSVGTAGVGLVSGGLIALNSSMQSRAMRNR